MNFTATKQVKEMVRRPYVWPGGYEKIAICNDGGVLCGKCVKEEIRNILHSTLFEYRDGWQVEAIDYIELYEEPIVCDHCGRTINEED